MNDLDMLESLALRLIQGMEELSVNWWIVEGWSFRRMRQEELNGSGSEDYEQEPESGTGAAPEVEAGDDGGDAVGGPTVVGKSRAVRRAFTAKKVAKAKARDRRKFSPTRRRRVAKRGWR